MRVYVWAEFIVENYTDEKPYPYISLERYLILAMEENKPKQPPRENTKDDSSDIEKVRQDKQAPPPEPEQQPDAEEESEAEKGHS
ncbi:hypothetical protein [Pontibacter kalidii]|uniref:hypothetical protein n=1 Tax=Pontibacter kalidii TaxID=2592049 RepID=UPI00225A05AE|nr:hypothetical protein [Pontibacter kalidii]